MRGLKQALPLRRRPILTALLCAIVAAAVWFVFFSLPAPLFDVPWSRLMLDRNGELLEARVAADEQWRFPPSGKELNEKFRAALVEYEDRRFYYHAGIDVLALGRALVQNIREQRIVSGASTITMQTIRIMLKNRKRTLIEKAFEALLSLRLEIRFSKAAILALYAANAPFGGNVVGLEAACWRWFGHSPENLSWGEAAALAVLPNSPSLIRPGKNEQLLRKKRDALLRLLRERNLMDDETLTLSLAEPLPGAPKPLPALAPHLMERIRQEQAALINKPSGQTGAYRVETTLDAAIQGRAANVLDRWAERFSRNGIMNAACLILDTQTGEVRAYLGNIAQRTEAGGYVDIISAPRSSGSILKPFLFAAMLDSGELLPKELVSDIPTSIAGWRPENYTLDYSGAVPAGEALARSLNIPAVRELRLFGVNRFAAFLKPLGITTLFRPAEQYGLTLIIGGAEVTLWEMAGAYAGLARSALDPDAQAAPFFPPQFMAAGEKNKETNRPISAGAAWLTLEALTEAARPDEEAAWRQFAGAYNIAWKTGTSFGTRDAWAIGVTASWTVAVWVGNASGEGRAELRGATTAAPLLFDMFAFLKPSPWFPKPALKTIEVCAFSGFPASPNCTLLRNEEIPEAAGGHRPCPYCRILTLNEEETAQIAQNAAGSRRTVQRGWFVLPLAEEWYYKRRNLGYKPPPPETGAAAEPPFAVFTPDNNALLYIPIELDGTPGKAVFAAAHRDRNATLYWHLDGSYLGATTNFHEMESRPSAGVHTLTVVDMDGNMTERRFSIMSAAD